MATTQKQEHRDLILRATGGKLYLHVEDCQQILNLSRRSIYRMREDGTGPRWQSMRGRQSVYIDEMAAWIAEQQEAAAEK